MIVACRPSRKRPLPLEAAVAAPVPSALVVRVISGSPAAVASLTRIIVEQCTIVAQPPMSLEVYTALVDQKALAGQQIGKDRVTLQETTLDGFARDHGAIGTFVKLQRKWASGAEGGSRVNDFWNINGGRSPAEKIADPPEWRLTKPLKINDGDGGGWHADNPTEGKKGKPNTGRVLSYYMIEGQLGSLRVRRDDAEVELVVPRGAALYASVRVLALEHKHGINGRCVSFVTEVSRLEEVVGATVVELAASSAAQPPLPFGVDFKVWEPWKWAEGEKLKWGFHGVGSPRRLAMSFVLGPKGGRGTRRKVTFNTARAIVADMSPEEIKKAASSVMGPRGACSRKRMRRRLACARVCASHQQ